MRDYELFERILLLVGSLFVLGGILGRWETIAVKITPGEQLLVLALCVVNMLVRLWIEANE